MFSDPLSFFVKSRSKKERDSCYTRYIRFKNQRTARLMSTGSTEM